MEFPHTHHHSHHHHQEDDRDREKQRHPQPSYPPPFDQPPPPLHPPPANHPSYEHPPPPNYTHTSHTSHAPLPNFTHTAYAPPPPPPNFTQSSYAPQPPPNSAIAHHVDHHHQNYPRHHQEQRLDERHDPAGTVTHHWHHSSSMSGLAGLSNKTTMRVYCKANPNYSLAVRNGKVILEPHNPADIFQQWYKDEKYSTRVKDEQGYPCFSLVNKATGLAMKHSDGDTQPVQLIPYNPDVLEMSVLWTESKDLDGGYKAVRMVNNIHLNVDAYHGDKLSGGVHDGTSIVLWQWNSGDNQLWKITSH